MNTIPTRPAVAQDDQSVNNFIIEGFSAALVILSGLLAFVAVTTV